MGAVRHRQLIQVLAMFVALDMAVGVVALSARRDGRNTVRTTLVAGSVGIPLNDRTGTGILAGAGLKKRRGVKNIGGSGRSLEAAPTTRPPASSASTSTATQGTIAGPSTTSTSLGLQATTTSGPKLGVTATPGSSPQATTATTRAPASAPTTGPGPTTTTRPPATTAPTRATTTTSQPPAAGQPRSALTLDDPAGDTFVDGTEKAINEPRADIVRAGAGYRQGFLAFVMQVQQPVDPRTDERWAGDATFALFSVDTNGDGQPDFDIQYSVFEGQVGGVVTRPNSTDAVCDVEGGYGPEGYSAIVDPACLGNPASVAFRVALYYDTNPKDENADVAADVAPNGGMSFPITKP